MRTVPLCGDSEVIRIRISVVLPLPFGPRKTRRSPGRIWRLISFSACLASLRRVPGYLCERLEISMPSAVT